MAKAGKRLRIECFRNYVGRIIAKREAKKNSRRPVEIFNPNIKRKTW